MINMTINELKEKLETIPGSARVYTSDPAGWLAEVTEVVVHYDEKLNQTWIEFVSSDD
jgi:hypothetical protein